MNRTSLIVERSRGFAHLSPLAGRGRIALVPTFRSSYTISAITFYELRKAMITRKFRILVPLFDLKSLGSFRRLRCRHFKSAALGRPYRVKELPEFKLEALAVGRKRLRRRKHL